MLTYITLSAFHPQASVNTLTLATPGSGLGPHVLLQICGTCGCHKPLHMLS